MFKKRENYHLIFNGLSLIINSQNPQQIYIHKIVLQYSIKL